MSTLDDALGLAVQAHHLWEASPLGYAIYALTTGAEADRATAAAMLNPGV